MSLFFKYRRNIRFLQAAFNAFRRRFSTAYSGTKAGIRLHLSLADGTKWGGKVFSYKKIYFF
jgi:hypothetical protein